MKEKTVTFQVSNSKRQWKERKGWLWRRSLCGEYIKETWMGDCKDTEKNSKCFSRSFFSMRISAEWDR